MLSVRNTIRLDYAGIEPLHPCGEIYAALDVGYFGGWDDSVAVTVLKNNNPLAIVAATPLTDGTMFVWTVIDKLAEKHKKSLMKALLYIKHNAMNIDNKYDIFVHAANDTNIRFAHALGFRLQECGNEVVRMRLWIQ